MMKALFIANLELVETEGIYKKVCAESDAIAHAVGRCDLITRKGNKAVIKTDSTVQGTLSDKCFWKCIFDLIESENVKIVYIRHMIPTINLIKFLRISHSKGIKIYYEIPTYPYFAEQFRTSRKKYRAIAKISLDILFWPWIYHYVDKLVIIRSNSKTKTYSKMVEITNGVRTDDIKGKNYELRKKDKFFRMVAVGTLYPYHGYDRILKGLQECKEKINGIIVEFHVIGTSKTIDDLHRLSDQMGLKHVIFHGTKTTEELNKMYDNFDVGLGCMALHRRNANVDTTLKIVEYYCRGVPVITSGKSPFKQNEFTFVVPDNEDPIDIKSIYDYYCGIDSEDLMKLSVLAKSQFSWENIMRNLLTDTF